MKYTNESITQLKGADRVRLRPGVIFGSDDIEGCQHSFFEILSNSIDEARGGHGRKIEVIRHSDRSITVADEARGIPVDYNNKEQRYNWELLFTEMYAGGKYNNSETETYKYSLGLNGLGLTATQYASEFMDVDVYRDGHHYELHFYKGAMRDGGYIKRPLDRERLQRTGTTIRWKPDLEVFKSIDIPLDYFQDVIKKQAIVNPRVRFLLKDEESGLQFEYYYERGIQDYVEERIEGKPGISDVFYFEADGRGRDRSDLKDYDVEVRVAFAFHNEYNALEYFHNSSYLEHGGSPDKAVRSAFVSEIDKLIKNLGKYTKNEKKISFVDVQDSLILVTSSFSTETSYENQTKKAINNRFIQEFMTESIRKNLEVLFIENAVMAEQVANQVLVNKRSREKAESTRVSLKKTLSVKMDVTNKVKKFVDCRTKDKDRRELYILEGDSALGSCKLARDSEFQALMPIRGKIMNCLKASLEDIFSSDIIIDLIRVFGTGVEIKSKHNKDFETFDYDALKWDKLIICTDADVDGFQIRTLILTMIYRLTPTLIEKGRVYIAESPLYEITDAKGHAHFAYNEKEKHEILGMLGDGKQITIQRSKGLGENDPDMMSITTMNPDTRRLIRVTPTDVEATQKMFEVLLGEDLDGRKSFIQEHGSKYLEVLDIS